ncbi:MAG: rhodanese family protein [Pseudomonadota bacterium]
MTLAPISAEAAQRLMAEGAVLVDVRDPDERARAHIPGSRSMPLTRLERLENAPAVIWHCRSGMRTQTNADILAQNADCPGYYVEGGLEGWQTAGLPVLHNRSAPLELMRQVQIAAGSLVMAGVILGFAVAPAFFGLSAAIGAGMAFAGISGWCGMARLLAAMPWNRRAGA